MMAKEKFDRKKAVKQLFEYFPEMAITRGDKWRILADNIYKKRNKYLKENFEGLCNFCKEVIKTEAKLPKEYKIGFGMRFWPNKSEPPFEMPMLEIKDKANSLVGVLGFKVGIPTEIYLVQGWAGERPQKFFKETGKHFDQVLIDKFISIVNRHFPQSRGKPPKPKVVFNWECLRWMSLEMSNRIVKRYLPREQVKQLVKKYFIKRRKMPRLTSPVRTIRIRERFFARQRRKAVRKKKPF